MGASGSGFPEEVVFKLSAIHEGFTGARSTSRLIHAVVGRSQFFAGCPTGCLGRWLLETAWGTLSGHLTGHLAFLSEQ